MPGISNLPSGGGADSALAWFRRTLADVIGLNPAAQELETGRLGTPVSAAQRTAIAELIGRRFVRTVDPATGRVTFERIGDEVLLAQPGERDSDPVVAQVSGGYLDAARAAISSIDPDLCLPEVCPERFRDVLAQIRRTLDLIAAEAPLRGSSFQVSLHVDELTAEPYGLLPNLGRMFERIGTPTVAEERAIAAVQMTARAVTSFEDAIARIRPTDEESNVEVVEIVRRCAIHVPAHVQRARNALREAGIGDCELESYLVPLGQPPFQLGAASYDRVPLSEILRTVETEPARWPMLIGVGRPEQVELVQESARTMIRLVTPVTGTKIAKGFGLQKPLAADVGATVDRAWAYIRSVFHAVARQPMPTNPPRSVPKRGSEPPAAAEEKTGM